VSQTLACAPRGAHAKRRGGNRSRSVSSSARMTLRAGSRRILRRIQRFFLSVRVWQQRVASALPRVVHPVHRSSDGARRDVHPQLRRQNVAEQRCRPSRRRVAEGVRGLHQEPYQQPSYWHGQLRRAPEPWAIMERAQISVRAEAARPVVQGLPRHAEAHRHVGHRGAPIQLQERDDALHDRGVPRALQRRPKPLPLPRRQPKVPHGSPYLPEAVHPGTEVIPQQLRMSNLFCPPT
jgi:hypothetical protein